VAFDEFPQGGPWIKLTGLQNGYRIAGLVFEDGFNDWRDWVYGVSDTDQTPTSSQ
jgi:hypothetical protein